MNKFFYEIKSGDQVWTQGQILSVESATSHGGFTTLELSDGTATSRADFDQTRVI